MKTKSIFSKIHPGADTQKNKRRLGTDAPPVRTYWKQFYGLLFVLVAPVLALCAILAFRVAFALLACPILLLPAPAIFALPWCVAFAFMAMLALVVDMFAPVPPVVVVLVVVVVVDMFVALALLAFSVDEHPTLAAASASKAERARVLRIEVFLLLPSGWLFLRLQSALNDAQAGQLDPLSKSFT
jgi:hypothetical protein